MSSPPKAVQTDAKSMNFPSPPAFPDTTAERKHKLERLAGAFRIFGKLGYDEGIAGHLTLRDPILRDHFWVNPLGLAFSLICVSDLLLISPEGDIVSGGKPDRKIYNTAAFAIQLDLIGLGYDLLRFWTQDCCAFYDDLAVYPSFGGVVLSGGEGERIAEHIGSCKAIILQNHGQLTVGETIESAVAWFIFLDRLCHAQLLLDAASNGTGVKPIMIGHDEATFTRGVTGTETSGWNGAQMYYQIIDAETGGSYKN